MKIPPSILRYWLAMNATAFDSAVSAAVMFCGAAGAHQATAELGYNVGAFNLQQLALLFLGSFGWAILQYLHSHPVMELLTHEINREIETESIKKTGNGGNATGARPAEPTAVPAPSPAALPVGTVENTYRPPT